MKVARAVMIEFGELRWLLVAGVVANVVIWSLVLALKGS